MPAGTITALQAQAHDSQRINVFLDGAFAIGISLTTLARERLYVGQSISLEAFERLEQAEQIDRAIQAAIQALEARPRSTAELRERLRRKGYSADAIDPALLRLTELGLIDDTAFARFWVESRQRSRPRGPGALRDELRRKGISQELIGAILHDEELVGDERQQAEHVARAALRKYAGAQDHATFVRRMGGFLQRRGYHPGIIRPIIERLWRELGRSDDDP